jgi:hypothetical protein
LYTYIQIFGEEEIEGKEKTSDEELKTLLVSYSFVLIQ